MEGRVYYLFRQRAAFYNSLGVARKMLTSNGILGSRVHLIEAESERQLQLGRKVDLVISLIAWGFHFPVDVYLDAVVNLLSEQGRVILDVRRDTNGVDLLRDNFPHVRVISEDKKKYRVAAGNQPFAG